MYEDDDEVLAQAKPIAKFIAQYFQDNKVATPIANTAMGILTAMCTKATMNKGYDPRIEAHVLLDLCFDWVEASPNVDTALWGIRDINNKGSTEK